MGQYFRDNDLPEGYTPEDIPQLDEEWGNLRLLWASFSETITDTVEGDIHHPPVLFGTVSNLFEVMMTAIPPNMMHFVNREAYNCFAAEMIAFGGMMFRFGQFAAHRGILTSNMSECRCSGVTDAALTKFLGDDK